MKGLQFHGGLMLAWAASEREFLQGAVGGMMISVICALVIFLIAT